MERMLKRISLVLHADVHDQLIALAAKENRSLNFTIASLLQKTIKEKNKKRAKKESGI